MPKDPDHIPFIVLGNKADKVHDRRVPEDRVYEWLNNYPEITYFETSASEGLNINEAFLKIAQIYLKL